MGAYAARNAVQMDALREELSTEFGVPVEVFYTTDAVAHRAALDGEIPCEGVTRVTAELVDRFAHAGEAYERASLAATPDQGAPVPGRPDLALLNADQLRAIRGDLREMQATQGWADITDGDIERLHALAVTVFGEERPGRGHDCRWMWSNGEIIVSGSVDVYGNGDAATWCAPSGWWVTATGEEPGE